MSTSGTYTYSRNRDQIINDALLLAGVIAEGDTVDSSLNAGASNALNALVKHWQATGRPIWTMAEATLFLQADQTTYTISSASTSDHATESYVETTISANEASGQIVISLTSTTGMTAADNVGIQVDDGTIHWTTIVSVDSATQITITVALDDSAAAGNLVIAYTSKIVRPLLIVSARRFNFDSDIETPIEVEARDDYFDLPNKTSSGTPNMIFYDRRGGANTTGKLYVWQPMATPTDAIKFTWRRPIQDFTVAGDDPDLPQEWLQALTYNLAFQEAMKSDAPDAKLARLEKYAAVYLLEMTFWERELDSVSFVPDLRR